LRIFVYDPGLKEGWLFEGGGPEGPGGTAHEKAPAHYDEDNIIGGPDDDPRVGFGNPPFEIRHMPGGYRVELAAFMRAYSGVHQHRNYGYTGPNSNSYAANLTEVAGIDDISWPWGAIGTGWIDVGSPPPPGVDKPWYGKYMEFKCEGGLQ
jgi:hypothetical protein